LEQKYFTNLSQTHFDTLYCWNPILHPYKYSN